MRGQSGLVAGAALVAAVLCNGKGSADVPSSFDKKGAAQALESVDLSKCKKPGWPTGEGHVLLTVLPVGKVKQAVVDTAPFANTKAAKCIAKIYEKATVPPFQGEPVVLGKKFRLE